MKLSSFGFIKVCDHLDQRIEYLEFLREGRFHQHKELEVFTVLRGDGLLITKEKETPIFEGQTYSIPPLTMHKMKPNTDELKILVTYVNYSQALKLSYCWSCNRPGFL